MCSVVGCYSDRRVVQRFKLPEDPERRLEWVQFLATVNKQRFKESSWTDITICREHFKDDCFESLTPSRSRTTLKPSAVPSLCVLPDETEPNVEERLKRVVSLLWSNHRLSLIYLLHTLLTYTLLYYTHYSQIGLWFQNINKCCFQSNFLPQTYK